MIVDAHHHLWDHLQREFDYRWQDAPELAPIRRSFLPGDLRPLLQQTGVERTVLVQTQHKLSENDWALRLADGCDFIAGVVGWVDLASPACEDQILAYKDRPKFVGVRHVTQDEPDDNFILRPAVLQGLRSLQKHNVPFDLLFYVKHLPHAVTLARMLPDLPMVIDHLAKPEIKTGRRDNWLEPLRAAAQFPNVYCKLSGMITEAAWRNWTTADLKPYVDTAIELFGAERCMFGSDWPVCLLAGTYHQVYAAMSDLLSSYSDTERAAIMGNTAVRFYRLTVE